MRAARPAPPAGLGPADARHRAAAPRRPARARRRGRGAARLALPAAARGRPGQHRRHHRHRGRRGRRARAPARPAARPHRGAARARDRGAAAQPAARLLGAQQQAARGARRQGRGLRAQVPQHLRARVQQRLLADAAQQQRHLPALRGLLRRPAALAHRARRAHRRHDRPHRARRQDLLPALVRRGARAARRRGARVQVHLVLQVGQLQAGHLPAVRDRVQAAAVALAARRTGLRLAGGAPLRHGEQQPARHLQQARAQAGLRRLRQGPRLPARGPLGAAGRVDRADRPAGRRQDLLLRAAGAPEREQGAAALRAAGPRARDAADAAGRPAERPGLPAHVPHQEDQPQAPERAHPVQRLPLQAHVRVRVHRAAGRRRGDHAGAGRHLAGAHGPRAAQGAQAAQRDPGLLQRAQRLLPRRPAPLPRVLQGHSKVSICC